MWNGSFKIYKVRKHERNSLQINPWSYFEIQIYIGQTTRLSSIAARLICTTNFQPLLFNIRYGKVRVYMNMYPPAQPQYFLADPVFLSSFDGWLLVQMINIIYLGLFQDTWQQMTYSSALLWQWNDKYWRRILSIVSRELQQGSSNFLDTTHCELQCALPGFSSLLCPNHRRMSTPWSLLSNDGLLTLD